MSAGDDLLGEATRALRDSAESGNDAARFTRSRVLASVRTGRVERRTRIAFLVPLLAAALAATAGATPGGRALFRAALEVVGLANGEDERPAVRATAVKDPAALPLAPVSPAATATVTQSPAPLPAVDAPAEGARTVVAAAPADRKAVTEAAPREVPPPAFDAAHALYREAHALHFSEHDPARALPAWDAYLARAPAGRFALEARYNRALCLVRLGRRGEALTALQPFASASPGSYRQDEASKLVEVLREGTK